MGEAHSDAAGFSSHKGWLIYVYIILAENRFCKKKPVEKYSLFQLIFGEYTNRFIVGCPSLA